MQLNFYFLLSLLIINFSKADPLGTLSFKYSEIDSSIIDIVWCGHRQEDIFALSELNSVYKSEDHGFTWKKLNDIFHSHAAKQLESDENEVMTYSKAR